MSADAPVPRDEGAISRRQTLDYALSPEGLHEAMSKCVRGTSWKRSVAAFGLNGVERCLSLSDAVADGSYRPRAPKRFTITRPKPRQCCSIGIRDRVFQCSLNDNVVYPAMSRSFIPANCACQTGKGTDYARDRFERYLKRHWHHHGAEGFVLLMDIRGYYPNMRHDIALSVFRGKLPERAYRLVESVLTGQYAGDVGFEAGSQLVQITGISVLDRLDHFIKERLRCKAYLRYMDDMLVVHHSREFLVNVRGEVDEELARLGMSLHPGKTRIVPVSSRVPWLGFTFELKPSGKVVRRVKASKMRDIRRRMRRFARKAGDGEMPLATADESVYTTIRYLRRNCTGRDASAKAERYWHELTKGLRT